MYTPSPVAESGLDAQQAAIFNKLKARHIYKSFHFVTAVHLSQASVEGVVNIDLPFLPAPSIGFESCSVDYADDLNFSWYGKSFSG